MERGGGWQWLVRRCCVFLSGVRCFGVFKILIRLRWGSGGFAGAWGLSTRCFPSTAHRRMRPTRGTTPRRRRERDTGSNQGLLDTRVQEGCVDRFGDGIGAAAALPARRRRARARTRILRPRIRTNDPVRGWRWGDGGRKIMWRRP
jgi:hypothetical protein